MNYNSSLIEDNKNLKKENEKLKDLQVKQRTSKDSVKKTEVETSNDNGN
eukprot:UN31426